MADRNSTKERLARVEEHCDWTKEKLIELNDAYHKLREGQSGIKDEVAALRTEIAKILEGQKTMIKVLGVIGTIISAIAAIAGIVLPLL